MDEIFFGLRLGSVCLQSFLLRKYSGLFVDAGFGSDTDHESFTPSFSPLLTVM